MITSGKRRPRWLAVVIIVCMLPVFSLPGMLSAAADAEGTGVMLWLYPFYVVCSGWFAWLCWTDRPWMTWILLVLMLMSHCAAWMLALMPPA